MDQIQNALKMVTDRMSEKSNNKQNEDQIHVHPNIFEKQSKSTSEYTNQNSKKTSKFDKRKVVG